MNSNRNMRGFTMIELIVVIIILGILAAVALPRFTNLQRDARIASLESVRGSVLSAMAMVNGTAIARQGQAQPACGTFGVPAINAAGNGTICTPQGLVQVRVLFPQAANAGVVAAAGLPITAAAQAADGYQIAAAGGGALRISITGGANPATCFFTYTPPTALGMAPTVSAINAASTAGC